MAKNKKMKFKGINNKTSFCEAARIILKNRNNAVKKTIKSFLNTPNVENLHDVRIAIRRLRYNMEIFNVCFDKKKFLKFYTVVEYIQDLTGQKRDLDVLLQNIKNLSENKGIEIAPQITNTFEEQRDLINDTLKFELFQYLHKDELKIFEKMLN